MMRFIKVCPTPNGYGIVSFVMHLARAIIHAMLTREYVDLQDESLNDGGPLDATIHPDTYAFN